MKKSEIIEKLREIYNEVDEMETCIDELKRQGKKIKSLLEDIPDEENEFCDDDNKPESEG